MDVLERALTGNGFMLSVEFNDVEESEYRGMDEMYLARTELPAEVGGAAAESTAIPPSAPSCLSLAPFLSQLVPG
jgi:hypothetical protein